MDNTIGYGGGEDAANRRTAAEWSRGVYQAPMMKLTVVVVEPPIFSV